jgi:acetyltransferase-like isoleucine patch superfamily enzyme
MFYAKIINRIYWLLKFKYRFLLKRTSIRGNKNSDIVIEKNVKFNNVMISVSSGSKLFIAQGTRLKNVNLSVKGDVYIGKNNFIYSQNKSQRLYIDIHGKLLIGSDNRLETNMRVRFNGVLSIGNYTNINTHSEIRCDEKVSIGDYNQISYNVVIWDTNTHNIYSAAKRRDLTETKGIGFEFEKPKTKPIFIGHDCWIGRDVAILKGVTVQNKCIIGFRTLLTEINLIENTTAVSDNSIKMFINKI